VKVACVVFSAFCLAIGPKAANINLKNGKAL
jgi:hypothetical protein